MNSDYTINISRKTLHFKIPARTSRGAYTEHDMLIVRITDADGNVGIGECAPLPDLSCDRAAYNDDERIQQLLNSSVIPSDMPALKFAMETAMAELECDKRLYDNPFARGEVGIPINGLVWMADFDNMLEQVKMKLQQGFSCIKLKIGAIDWEKEIELIRFIRSRYDESALQLRVDANGAFTMNNAMERLCELSNYGIHSIEQPIRSTWEDMSLLCKQSPLPIALDEELIGVNNLADKQKLLDTIHPQYIVIKPTLHGGISGTLEWIDEAKKRNIDSWITSALESNIGLRTIALLAAYAYGPDNTFPQGLGTGQLFTDNVNEGEMEIREGRIWIQSV